MSMEFRESMRRAKDEYRLIAYRGDLATELLPRRMSHWVWAMPAIAGAMAAMVAVVVWNRQEAARPGPAVAVVQNAQPKTRSGAGLLAIADINYALHVRTVNTGMRDVVHVLQGGVDKALHAPLVTEGVEKVNQVKANFEQIATITWSQMVVAPKGPC